MDSLTKTIYQSIAEAFDEFAERLVLEVDGLDKDKILEVWNSAAPKEIQVNGKPAKKAVTKKKPDDNTPKCVHVLTKGNTKGQECGAKICTDSTTGSYCKRHLKFEGEPAKTPGKPRAKNAKAVAKEEKKEVIKNIISSAPKDIKRNSWGNYEDPKTKFVFNAADKTVIGKQNHKTGKIDKLTTEDIEVCKRLRYQVVTPKNLTSKEERNSDAEVDLDNLDDLEDEEEEDLE